MPLFEKINNHTLRQMQLATGNPAPLTKIEKGWLKRMLAEPAAEDLLPATLHEKLRHLLECEVQFPNAANLEEKGKTTVGYSPAGSLLHGLRTAIRDHRGVRLDYAPGNGDEYQEVFGIPHQLEFSMVRREWYLLWLNPENQPCRPMTMPLRFIRAVRAAAVLEDWEKHQRNVLDWLEQSQEALVLLAEECYPGALLSVLNAFSCFDTTVASGEQKNTLRLRVRFQADEREYVLQKIRFLGRRVTMEGPDGLRERMRWTAERALERYGEA